MDRYAQIITTLGPASNCESVLLEMAKAGMNVARLNFSHGEHKSHQKMVDIIRNINKREDVDIKILQDLEGYRIRIGHFEGEKNLNRNDEIILSNKALKFDNFISFDYAGDLNAIKKGMEIFIDDGRIALKVISVNDDFVKLKVIQPGILKQRKGINIPSLKLDLEVITEKDKNDIRFGIKNKVDFIAQSFVRNRVDIKIVCDLVKPRLPNCKIIAKIENQEGVENIDEILDNCDGIMIARGDLGVSLPIYKIPMIQKYIIRHCIRKKKYVITATQMLETMTDQTRPTRAEVSDVANAILDGADFVMLSGETAVGIHPQKVVAMMRHIVEYTESQQDFIKIN